MCYLCRNLIYIIRLTNSREVDKRYRGSVCWMSVQPQIKLRGRQIDLCVANCSNSSHTNYARIFDVIISMLFHSHTDCKKRKATWTRNKTFSRVMQLIKIIFLQWHANTGAISSRLDWKSKNFNVFTPSLLYRIVLIVVHWRHGWSGSFCPSTMAVSVFTLILATTIISNQPYLYRRP